MTRAPAATFRNRETGKGQNPLQRCKPQNAALYGVANPLQIRCAGVAKRASQHATGRTRPQPRVHDGTTVWTRLDDIKSQTWAAARTRRPSLGDIITVRPRSTPALTPRIILAGEGGR
jgi:hypothetical protein